MAARHHRSRQEDLLRREFEQFVFFRSNLLSLDPIFLLKSHPRVQIITLNHISKIIKMHFANQEIILNIILIICV